MSIEPPPSASPSSSDIQTLAGRHVSTLQRLRDETLIWSTALDNCPESSIQDALGGLQPFIKGKKVDVGASLDDAKLSMAFISLRRLLQANASFFSSLYNSSTSRDSTGNTEPSAGNQIDSAAPQMPLKKVFESFQNDLKKSGANELSAVAIGSLLIFERVIGEALFGPAPGSEPRPDVLELVLIEVHKTPDEKASINAQPWNISLRKRQTPEIDARLLNAFFTTVFVASLEAIQIASKKP